MKLNQQLFNVPIINDLKIFVLDLKYLLQVVHGL